MPPIDATDAKILLALDANPQATVVALAATLKMSRNTVHARLARLEESGALAAPSRRLKPSALGQGLLAFLTLSISQASSDDANAALTRIPEVVEMLSTTGEGDLLVRVLAQDTADLYRVTTAILACPGVVRSSTSIVLNEVVPLRLAPLLERRAAGVRDA